MPSKRCRLPTEFGQFSNLPSDRIKHIRTAALAATRAFKDGDIEAWKSVILAANAELSKHERGVFAGLIIAGVEHAA